MALHMPEDASRPQLSGRVGDVADVSKDKNAKKKKKDNKS